MVADIELVEALGNELQVHFLIDATKARSESTAAAETEELGDLPTCRWARPRPRGWPASRPAATSGPARG